ALGEAEVRSGLQPGAVQRRFLPRDVDEQLAFPTSPVGFAQTRVEARREAEALPDDLGRHTRPRQVRGPQRRDPRAEQPLSERAGLTTSGLVQRRVAEAL